MSDLRERVAKVACDAVNGEGAFDETGTLHRERIWYPVSDAVIDLVLEEAARVAEAYPARTHGALATAPYAAAEQAADEIATAIRALKEKQ